jgi:acylpyruvate hydrolase
MKFVHFTHGGRNSIGLLEGSSVRVLADTSLEAVLSQGIELADFAADHLKGSITLPEADITYLPLLDNPPKIICVGLNFADHTKESNFAQPDYPTLFGRFNTSLVAHKAPMVRPLISDSFDYEGEVAVVLKKGGRHIPKSEALACVAGYSLFNDGSVREYQFKSPQWTVGKNFDAPARSAPSWPPPTSCHRVPRGSSWRPR